VRDDRSMRVSQLLVRLSVACLVGASGVAACSGDPPVSTPHASSDAATGTDAPSGSDGAIADASTCTVPTASGIQCFSDTRCKPILEACCVSLQGGNTLQGVCIPKGANAVDTCIANKAALWECDRAKDCPSGGARCCVSAILNFRDRTSCPVLMGLGDAGPPPDGRVTRCAQAACAADEVVACETDAECTGPGEKCRPILIQGKTFGLCLKP